MVVPYRGITSVVKQVVAMGDKIAFLSNGKVYVSFGKEFYDVDMGDVVGDSRDVVEFTISGKKSIIVRNADGAARTVTFVNKTPVYGDIEFGVFRVAGGKILKTNGNYAVSDDGFIPLASDGSIDMIPYPNARASRLSVAKKNLDDVVYIKDDTSEIRKKMTFDGSVYELDMHGTLKKDDKVIANDVVDMSVFRQTESYGYVSGNFPNADNPMDWNFVVKNETKRLLAQNGASSDWIAEYERFMDNFAQHPGCMWAGAGTQTGKTLSLSPCIHTYDTINGKKYVTKLVYIKSDGKLYDENAQEQIVTDGGANGFKAFYEQSGTKDSIIAVDTPDTTKRFADISPFFYNDEVGVMY